MARGKSGRIVLEVDPLLKRKLYLALEQNQITLKEWFIETADSYIRENISMYNSEHSLVAEENIDKYITKRVQK